MMLDLFMVILMGRVFWGWLLRKEGIVIMYGTKFGSGYVKVKGIG